MNAEKSARQIRLFSGSLVAGLSSALLLATWAPEFHQAASTGIRLLMTVLLAYIMIDVGKEFKLDNKPKAQGGTGMAGDYGVAMLAAAVPWLLVALCAHLLGLKVELPVDGHIPEWVAILFVARFAAPTSAGVLFSMLKAANLEHTWMYRKARVLAVFDDVDTILLLIPLQMVILGMQWQLVVVLLVTTGLLFSGWKYFRQIAIPNSTPWILAYAAGLTFLLEGISWASLALDAALPLHIEVLLPAFILGVVMAPAEEKEDEAQAEGSGRLAMMISLTFLALVGPSLPTAALAASVTDLPRYLVYAFILLVLGNLGKMAPTFFYRAEASVKERLALSVGMWPRGEVGAGVLAVAVSLGIGGEFVTVAALSLALNLALTGTFIGWVQRLLKPTSDAASADPWIAIARAIAWAAAGLLAIRNGLVGGNRVSRGLLAGLLWVMLTAC